MSKENKEHKLRKLRVSLIDEVSHTELWALRGRQQQLIYALLSTLVIIFLILFQVVARTPLRSLIPGYPNAEQKRAATTNAMTIDSLESVVARWEFYTENLKRVLDGSQAPLNIDSLLKISTIPTVEVNKDSLALQDSLLRALASQAEQFGLRSEERKLPIEGMHFFPPVKGLVSNPFDKFTHPYSEVTAPGSSVILALSDGTVMDASWSDDFKYTILIQHGNDLVSILKGAGRSLVRPGDKVKGGAPVGMMQSGSISDSPEPQTLRIEIWYKGEAVDPASYINF